MTETQKLIAIDDVLKIIKEYKDEIEQSGISEYKRESAKIHAFERIIENIDLIEQMSDG